MAIHMVRPWGRNSKSENKMSATLEDRPNVVDDSDQTPRRVIHPKVEIKMPPPAAVAEIDRVMRAIATDRRDVLREIVAAYHEEQEIDVNYVAELLLDEGKPALYFEALLTQYRKSLEAYKVSLQIDQHQAYADDELIRIRDLSPMLEPLADALTRARNGVSEPPTADQLAAVRHAEAKWGPLADQHRIANGKRNAAISLVNSLRSRASIAVRKDPDSRLEAPLNFAFPE